jgi:hypothetical protein
MFNPKAPLWLPYGSVRALLALMLVAVTCWGFATDRITGEAFMAVAASVVAFYFGTKAGTPNPNEPAP